MPHTDSVYGYPSVTEVTGCKPKPWLNLWKEKWASRVTPGRRDRSEWKLEAANKIGTAFHEGVRGLALGEVVDPPMRRVYNMLAVVEPWLTAEKLQLIDSELKVVSHIHKYEGTLDAVCKILRFGDTLVLIDWKTSAGVYPDMGMQLVAYAKAYQEQTGIELKKALIVHVSKKRPHKLTVREFKVGKREFNKFLKLRQEWQELHDAAQSFN